MYSFKQEVQTIQEYRNTLLGKFGLMKAFGALLASIGHIVIIYQVVFLSWGVITSTEGIFDALLWIVLFLIAIVLTPKLLNMKSNTTLFFIKYYTIFINSIFASIFIYLLFTLITASNYIIGDYTPTTIEHNHIDLAFGADFHYINAIYFLYISFWGFAIYINRNVPEGYLNYASAPIFAIITLAIISTSFNSSTISLYNFFNYSNSDGGLRVLLTTISIGMFLIVIKKTVFKPSK